MRTYLAGKYSAKERLRELAEGKLADIGIKVHSRWLFTDYEDEETVPVRKQEAKVDIDDVLGAKLFILDTLDESTTGGREFEFGLFTANRAVTTGMSLRSVILIGPKRHVFHELVPPENCFASWEEFFDRHVHFG